ncbi:MAG: hypothetical protein ACOX6N_04245 [Patescibacteria group bacterium]|jgi:hypothetical protein
MKKWNFFRAIGLMAAVVLVLFGSIDNGWRTIKLALKGLKNL